MDLFGYLICICIIQDYVKLFTWKKLFIIYIKQKTTGCYAPSIIFLKEHVTTT